LKPAAMAVLEQTICKKSARYLISSPDFSESDLRATPEVQSKGSS
jgi:hypothetical protein